MSDCFGDVQDEKVPRCMLGTKEITEKLQKKKKIDQLHINKQTRTMFQEPSRGTVNILSKLHTKIVISLMPSIA